MTYLEFKVRLNDEISTRSDEGKETCREVSKVIVGYCDDNKEKYAAFVSCLKRNDFEFIVGGNCSAAVLKREGRRLWKMFRLEGRISKITELSSLKVISALGYGPVDNHEDIRELFKIDGLRSIAYDEEVVSAKDISELETVSAKRNIAELKEESRRIPACASNKFTGHPVHYLYSCDKSYDSYAVIYVLIGVLLKSHRLDNGRMIFIDSAIVPSRYSSSPAIYLEDIYENIAGGTVVVNFDGPCSDGEYVFLNEDDSGVKRVRPI